MDLKDANWASALGIKGQARLRAHPRAHNAHIELREIEPPEDAEDSTGNTLYFSFFSAKPLNFKAGRELLFRVDNRFDGRSLLLEGDKYYPEKDEKQPVQPVGEVPLKFRKSHWNGIAQANKLQKPPVTYSEIGVQAGRHHADACVQAEVSSCSAATQVSPTTVCQSVQSSPPPEPVVEMEVVRSPSPMDIEDSPEFSPVELVDVKPPISPISLSSGLFDMELSPLTSCCSSPTSTAREIEEIPRVWDEAASLYKSKGLKAARVSSESRGVGDASVSSHSQNFVGGPASSTRTSTQRLSKAPVPPTVSPIIGSGNSPAPSPTCATVKLASNEGKDARHYLPRALMHPKTDTTNSSTTAPRRAWDKPTTQSQSHPPPPVATFDNPLGIGPSRRIPPAAPKALATATVPSSKKKLQIGTGWLTNGSKTKSPVASRKATLPPPPSPLQVDSTQQPVEDVTAQASKWKRLVPVKSESTDTLLDNVRVKTEHEQPVIPSNSVSTDSASSSSMDIESISPVSSVSPTLVDTASPTKEPLSPVVGMHHPLPPRPADPQGSASAPKRQRVTSVSTAPRPKKKPRNFGWPSVEWTHTLALEGSSDMTVKSMAMSSNGLFIALCCVDKRIRVINSCTRQEVARLDHDSALVNVQWMENDDGLVSLTESGVVGKWTRESEASDRWIYAKLITADSEKIKSTDDVCFVYHRDRFAISFPKSGIYVWTWLKGRWQNSRPILKKAVTTMKFVDDGKALIGGTKTGILWRCAVPDGTFQTIKNFRSHIIDVDVHDRGSVALVVRLGANNELTIMRNPRGHVDTRYALQSSVARPDGGFGVKFAAYGQGALYGSVDGCALMWDTATGTLVYGMSHAEGDRITAAVGYDGVSSTDGYLITATQRGTLHWWQQPASKPPN